jgi:hypothetical protein
MAEPAGNFGNRILIFRRLPPGLVRRFQEIRIDLRRQYGDVYIRKTGRFLAAAANPDDAGKLIEFQLDVLRLNGY